jgi:hypothetical protein
MPGPTVTTGTQFSGAVAISGSLTLSGSLTSTVAIASASFATTASALSNIAIQARVYNAISATVIEANVNTESLTSGVVNLISTLNGSITITLSSGQPVGTEFSFILHKGSVANSASFTRNGTTLYPSNGYTKMYGTGSFVTVKYLNEAQDVAIYGDLKP